MTLIQLKYTITVAGERSLNDAAKSCIYHSQVCHRQYICLKKRSDLIFSFVPKVE